MKYAAIVTYIDGSQTGAVVEADNKEEAWQAVNGLFHLANLRAVQIAQILLPERGG